MICADPLCTRSYWVLFESVNLLCNKYEFVSVNQIWLSLIGNTGKYQRKNDVVLMSMRRDDVASTSIRRQFGSVCLLALSFTRVD